MKRIVAFIIVFCMVLSCSVSALSYNTQLVKSIATIVTKNGVFNEPDDVYLQAILNIVEKHPELSTEILKEILSAKDKHGYYYTPEEAKKLQESLSSNVEGIGVTITAVGESLVVSQLIKDAPAEKAGIKEGDIIVSADGQNLIGMELDVAISYIRGASGTTVNVGVRRGGAVLTFDIVRAPISTQPVEYEILDGNIGYIRISSFSKGVASEFNKALNAFGFDNIKNIIIDVRNNGGGYLEEAVEIADYFLPNGKVITSEKRKDETQNVTFYANGPKVGYKAVVLINEYSASASEVLCAALVENGVAVTVGATSYGKGTVQDLISLPSGAMMKYTTAFYQTPKGEIIDGTGIEPEFAVDNQYVPLDITQFTELKYKKTYTEGMSDTEIKNAKEILDYVGLYHGEVNEYFDESLGATIKEIQKASNCVPQTGNLDPITQLEILKIMCDTKVLQDNQLETAKEYFAK